MLAVAIVFAAERLAGLPFMASCVEPFSSSVAQETDARSGTAEGCVEGLP